MPSPFHCYSLCNKIQIHICSPFVIVIWLFKELQVFMEPKGPSPSEMPCFGPKLTHKYVRLLSWSKCCIRHQDLHWHFYAPCMYYITITNVPKFHFNIIHQSMPWRRKDQDRDQWRRIAQEAKAHVGLSLQVLMMTKKTHTNNLDKTQNCRIRAIIYTCKI